MGEDDEAYWDDSNYYFDDAGNIIYMWVSQSENKKIISLENCICFCRKKRNSNLFDKPCLSDDDIKGFAETDAYYGRKFEYAFDNDVKNGWLAPTVEHQSNFNYVEYHGVDNYGGQQFKDQSRVQIKAELLKNDHSVRKFRQFFLYISQL